MVVVVTGALGQLGQALQHVAPNYPQLKFIFASSAEADITNKNSLKDFFSSHKPDFCINAAAYTAVDKAETEPEKAFDVNVTGPRNLAEICNEFATTLLHISTDFVFDGNKTSPYTEDDVPNPQSIYGKTKLEGENEIKKLAKKYFIIRTSWIYSQFGNNFMKTMIRLASEKSELRVVNDQIGTPTHAIALAKALIKILQSNAQEYGIYNYSGNGLCTWYIFAKKIFEINKINIVLHPISTTEFGALASRPRYSVLDNSKIKSTFDLSSCRWEDYIKPF